jgi:hypothetical protein
MKWGIALVLQFHLFLFSDSTVLPFRIERERERELRYSTRRYLFNNGKQENNQSTFHLRERKLRFSSVILFFGGHYASRVMFTLQKKKCHVQFKLYRSVT